jgi:hypothetical protein
MKFTEHDFKFIYGDLNFRLAGLDKEEVESRVARGDLAELFKNDEFVQFKQSNPIGLLYTEGEMNFKPTYKYDVGTNTYDTSSKARAPAWCDRILFNDGSGIKAIEVNSIDDIMQSDHKPIYGIFMAEVEAK